MIFTYDGTYAGLLSAVFESYRLKSVVTDIVPETEYMEQLFAEPVFAATNDHHAKRGPADVSDGIEGDEARAMGGGVAESQGG